MLVNAANLAAQRIAFNTLFNNGLGLAEQDWMQIATVVPATTKEQKYGWLGKIPRVREWIGPRAVQNLMQGDYSIKEKPLELTVSVDKDDFETDNLGIYAPLFTEMGQATGSEFGAMVYAQLAAGFTTNCYDGQFFFDTDHPVLDKDGNQVSVANTDGGAGTPWFLLDVSRAIKPILLQKRKDFQFTSLTKEDDANVFMNKEYIYGADARANTGYGFWQMAWGSRQPLTAANYEIARAALGGMKGDYGRPLGIKPGLLVVPSSLEGAANRILNSEYGTGGITNEWKGTARMLMTSWL